MIIAIYMMNCFYSCKKLEQMLRKIKRIAENAIIKCTSLQGAIFAYYQENSK